VKRDTLNEVKRISHHVGKSGRNEMVMVSISTGLPLHIQPLLHIDKQFAHVLGVAPDDAPYPPSYRRGRWPVETA